MRIRTQQDDKAEISLSPLVDCVFLLLIFFLVATMIKKQTKDIDVQLPESSSAVRLRPDDQTLVIGIDELGALYLEGHPSGRTALRQQLMATAARDADKRIRLDADAEAPFHRVVEVLDLCQFYDLNNVGIRTYDEQYNRR